jgi:hypothetical protein
MVIGFGRWFQHGKIGEPNLNHSITRSNNLKEGDQGPKSRHFDKDKGMN